MSTTLEAPAAPTPPPDVRSVWIPAFGSFALLALAIMAPIPVPLVAALAMLFGYLGVRAARRHPEFVLEKWMARAGLWGAIFVLVLTIGMTMLGFTRTSSFG